MGKQASNPSEAAAGDPFAGVPDSVREAQDRYIQTWGQMGSAWGISRTMAEVHALLYITGLSLCTDDVMARLQISRGNASMSLRALQDWGIIKRTHKPGDRKEYFFAESDVWAMFRTIASERKKREIDPVVQALFEIRDLTQKGRDEATKGHNERLDSMLQFMQTVEALSGMFFAPDGGGLQEAVSRLSDGAP
ncbi:MAG: transcriptional regulator [Planctomycetota bacterium]